MRLWRRTGQLPAGGGTGLAVFHVVQKLPRLRYTLWNIAACIRCIRGTAHLRPDNAGGTGQDLADCYRDGQ